MGVLRATWQLLAGWLVMAVLGLTLVALILVSFGLLGELVGRSFLRAWGRSMLWIASVEVVVEGAEHLEGRRPRIITFNHGSTLDGFIVNALLPPGGTPVARRSLIWVPVMGLVIALGPIVMVDRGNGPRARRTLARAGRRIREESLSVVIAPEGTRRGDEKPGRFKLGAFELARETGAPIVPLVIIGAERLMPYGRLVSRPGRVRVKILPPIDTSDYTEENLREHADALRELYRQEMAAAAS
ncbi:MAG: 1-acyl-sn-glycerol-3-phosphate acyltransferase [Myxococcales bacterium]|nr:1-acyl-sn-glycerol-3-phosphate acyltransferase [Myxococcales bacterium]